MMNILDVVLLLLGAVCFLIGAFVLVTHPRVNVLALGLLFWILVPLIDAITHIG